MKSHRIAILMMTGLRCRGVHFLQPWWQLPYCIFDYSTRKGHMPNLCGWLDLKLKTLRFGNKTGLKNQDRDKMKLEAEVKIKWDNRPSVAILLLLVIHFPDWVNKNASLISSGPRHNNNVIRLERSRGQLVETTENRSEEDVTCSSFLIILLIFISRF